MKTFLISLTETNCFVFGQIIIPSFVLCAIKISIPFLGYTFGKTIAGLFSLIGSFYILKINIMFKYYHSCQILSY